MHTEMPSIAPRPSQLLKILAATILIVLSWLLLGGILSKLPYWLSIAEDWAQDSLYPGCALRKGPLVHFIDGRTGRVVWEGRCPDTESKVYFRSTGSNNTFDLPGNFEYTPLSTRHHLFSGILTDLLPGTTYEYFVVYRGWKTQTYHFKSPPEQPTQLLYRVGIIGDSQLGVGMFRRNLKTLSRHRPQLFLHLGDIVQHADRLREWYTLFFCPIMRLQDIPLVATSGNHDWFNRRPNFYLHDRAKTYFAMTVAGARLIVLDSERENAGQTAWLESELSSPAAIKATFRIIAVHVPPYIEFWDPRAWSQGDSSWPLYVRKHWVPLFRKYNVDLVLSGHQHNYQRGFRDGIHYIISGGGGGDLDRIRVESYGMYRVTQIEHHFCLLDIGPDSLSLTALTPDNRVLDELRIERKLLKKYTSEKN